MTNLTLIFNPAYDDGAFVPELAKGETRFYRRYVGPKGLLDELELRLGIKAKEPSRREQLAEYLKAANATAARDNNVFFAKSLKLSPLATAGELLSWRDELVMSGWTADSTIPDGLASGAKMILKDLAAVEKELKNDFRTDSDRWQFLLSTLKKGVKLEDFSVVISVPETHLHPTWRDVLDKLPKDAAQCNMTDSPQCIPNVDIKRFKDISDACLWATVDDRKSLLVCSDSLTLGAAMDCFGQEYCNAASTATSRPVEHLFVSAMMLVKDGNDLQAMREYLASPSHPLNKYKITEKGPTLRQALLQHIVSTGGFGGNRYQETFDTLVVKYAHGDPKVLDEINSYIPGPSQKLTFKRIERICNKLSSWAAGCIKAVEDKGETSLWTDQWSSLADYCREMVFQCKELGFDKLEEIKDTDLVQAVRSIYTPSTGVVMRAMVKSLPVVSNIKCIAEDVQNVIWVDGAYADTPTPLPFLCINDAEELKKAIPGIWQKEDVINLEDELFQAGLSHIKGKLTILQCDTFHGEKKEKHLFTVQQASVLGQGKNGLDVLDDLEYEKVEEKPDKLTEACKTRPANTCRPEYFIDFNNITLPDHESPSSLEKMLEQPYDWFVERVLGLYEEGDSNMSLIKGNVAHNIIQKLYEIAATKGKEVSADAFEKAFQENFESFFYQAVRDTGAELFRSEYAGEREQFKITLRLKSIPKLIEIIRHSGLTIMGSEVEYQNIDISRSGKEPLKITCYIDLLLKNSDGDYVILDFKWQGKGRQDKRKEQIKNGKDYQLAIYREVATIGTDIVPAGNVAAQGFYMLRTAELLTADNGFSDSKDPVPTVPRDPRLSHDKTIEYIVDKYDETIKALKETGTEDEPAGKLIIESSKKNQYSNNNVLMGKLY